MPKDTDQSHSLFAPLKPGTARQHAAGIIARKPPFSLPNVEDGRGEHGFTPDALSDIHAPVDRDAAVAWWPSWPAWASTESRDEWDVQEALARTAPCPRCGALREEACRHADRPAAFSVTTSPGFRCFHIARIRVAELLESGVDDEADAVRLDLSDKARAYLATLRDRVTAAERLQRIGAGLSPLDVVTDAEVRS